MAVRKKLDKRVYYVEAIDHRRKKLEKNVTVLCR